MNDLMKGWASICFGSLAGAGLGAASFFAIEALIPQQAAAHSCLWGGCPSHSCSEPWDKSNQWDIDSFKSCIEDFVDEQKAAIKRHAAAADEAIEDWNSFARGW